MTLAIRFLNMKQEEATQKKEKYASLLSSLSDLKQKNQPIEQLHREQTVVIDALKDIGLARYENKDRNLDGECLWVPASVNHHVANNSMLFIYGGVRVMPKVNALNPSDPRFSQTMNNAFNSCKATINGSNITSANNSLGRGNTAQQTWNNSSRAPNIAAQQSGNIGARNNQSSSASANTNASSSSRQGSNDGGSGGGGGNGGNSVKPDRTIKDPLRRDIHGNPAVDPEFKGKPHTQLGTKNGSKGAYTQAREFDAKGKPVRDIHCTDHGRSHDHTNPHQHKYEQNSTGGTLRRGKAEPIDEKYSSKPGVNSDV